MRRLFSISLFLLVFALSGCYSDTTRDPSEDIRPVEADYAEEYLRDRDFRPVAVATTAVAPTPVERTVGVERPIMQRPSIERPTSVRPRLLAMDGPGFYTVSMTYPSADCGIIQVDKTMPREVGVKEPFEYSIRVTNLTDMPLVDVVITEDLPDNFRLTSTNPTVYREANKLVWRINSFGARAAEEITVSGMAAEIDSLRHYTMVTYTTQTSADIRVVQPRLELVKTAPTEVALCEPIPVEFTVTNLGTGATQDVKIVDTLPAGLQTADGKGEVILDVGTLEAGQSRQFSVELQATKTGVYDSKAVATSASGLQAESEATVTAVRQPLLTIVKSGPKLKYLGRLVTYEITVANVGDGTAKDTIVEDTVPVEATSIEATGGAKLSGSKLVWELGDLAREAVKTVRVSYMPTRIGTLTSSATASAYCTEGVIASAKTSVVGIGAVRLEVIDIDDPVEVGERATYVITVTNQGSAPDTNIRVDCVLEDKVEYVSSAGATTGSVMGNMVNFAPLHTLAPGTKATWRIVVKGVRPGDVRFKVSLNTDQLVRPVEESEATHVYE